MKNKFDDENDFQCCNKCDLPDTLQIVNVLWLCVRWGFPALKLNSSTNFN